MIGGGEMFVPRWKRKEVDDVNEDFSDFSISAPARKIRRLDLELPPIIENTEEDFAMMHPAFARPNGVEIMELNPGEENQERALVLYNHCGSVNPLSLARPDVTISMDSKFIAGMKNKHKLQLQDEEDDAKRSVAANSCLALVPWTPSSIPSPTNANEITDEEMGETAMEIEDNPEVISQDQVFGFTCGGFPQWQQHCMIPQPPQNNPTPIIWFQ